MPLNDAICRALKPKAALFKRSDAGGLQLWVMPNGSKLWRVAYRHNRKQKILSVGAYPTVTLSEAREHRDQAKKHLAKRIDPSEVKKQALTDLADQKIRFRPIAEEFIVLQRRNGRAEVTIKKTEWLLGFAYPTLGDKQITKIGLNDVLAVLRKVEGRGRYETACRLRSIIGRVFRHAALTGISVTDPTYTLQGVLAKPKPKSHAAIVVPKDFGALLRAIDEFEGQPPTLAALQLMALLFPRPGELRSAEWAEFNFEAAVWTIPASHTKLRREHRVPLAPQALKILRNLYNITGGGRLAFPSVRTAAKPISENTLNAALRRLGYTKDQATSHGFRASASSLLNEAGQWHVDAIERQLAHIEGNKSRRPYLRAEHWDERVRMMNWWANYLNTLKSDGLIAFPTPARCAA